MHSSGLPEVLRCPLYVKDKTQVVYENFCSTGEEKKPLFFSCLEVLLFTQLEYNYSIL